ncbi:hypothetical protein SLEP1_g13010 [Rubroshorea leprosula]|uniref:Srp40 C-terminal domain-containing protein n=1 Tax=Rubroshorea leprosula TaxID=152421 RepID=A0AAV5IKF0_9ROSI|nr:hypothetical protein SLEP1_g13010 [Rubroshorea leprosula]
MPHSQNPPNPSLLAFKPRQVLLSSHSAMDKTQKQTLKPHQRTLLLQSIALFLQQNAFSKTLKKFRAEAQIQEDGLKGSTPNLEELFHKYSEICDHAVTNSNGEKVEEVQVDGDSKKKKKRSKESDGHLTVTKSDAANKSATDVGGGSQLEASKKKHKNKTKKGEVVENLEHHPSESLPEETEKNSKQVVSSECNEVTDAETENRTKDKKTKKNKTDEQHDSENKPDSAIPLEDKDAKSKKRKKEKDDSAHDYKTSNEDVPHKESKGSKKRKQTDSEVNDSLLVDGKAVVESKRRKKEGLEDAEETKQPVTADKRADEESEENGKDSAMKKNVNGQSNGSAQPKKPFQRVNVDEVVFIDKRLEDNSYWAKDGADTGYGAKAEEVLGQVRGRDFRHEKTKKKRGSYRGGQIDLQSHSVKFNYSDDE